MHSYLHVTLVRVPYRHILISLIASDWFSVDLVQAHTNSFPVIVPFSVMQVGSKHARASPKTLNELPAVSYAVKGE